MKTCRQKFCRYFFRKNLLAGKKSSIIKIEKIFRKGDFADGKIVGGRILELESERLLRTGKEQGLIQGEEKAKLDIAKKMLERGFSLEDIQFSTELSKKELEKL